MISIPFGTYFNGLNFLLFFFFSEERVCSYKCKRSNVEVSSFLLSRGSQELNSGHQAGWEKPLPADALHQAPIARLILKKDYSKPGIAAHTFNLDSRKQRRADLSSRPAGAMANVTSSV